MDLRRVDSPPAEKAGTVLKAEAHVARNALAARGHVRVVWVLWPAQGILVLVYIARVEVLKLR